MLASCIGALWLPLSAGANGDAPPEDNASRLQRLVNDYVDARRPGASRASRTDFTAEAFLAELEEQRSLLASMASISAEGLTLEQDIDRRLLLGIARADVATTEARRAWENDPALYAPATRLGALLQDEGADDVATRAEGRETRCASRSSETASGAPRRMDRALRRARACIGVLRRAASRRLAPARAPA